MITRKYGTNGCSSPDTEDAAAVTRSTYVIGGQTIASDTYLYYAENLCLEALLGAITAIEL